MHTFLWLALWPAGLAPKKHAAHYTTFCPGAKRPPAASWRWIPVFAACRMLEIAAMSVHPLFGLPILAASPTLCYNGAVWSGLSILDSART